MSQHGLEVLYWFIVSLILSASTAAVTWFGARQVLSSSLTLGELLVFLAYMAQMFEPLAQNPSRLATLLVRTSMDDPFARSTTAIITAAIGHPPVRMPSLGGSIPMYLFVETLGVPMVGLPIANHDDNQHAANENVRLQNLWDGIEVFASFFTSLDNARN
jgi:ABC-type multidrug transport system fused ATPase/permease subunit